MDSGFQHCLGHPKLSMLLHGEACSVERPASQSNQRASIGCGEWEGGSWRSRSLARLESIGSHLPAVPCVLSPTQHQCTTAVKSRAQAVNLDVQPTRDLNGWLEVRGGCI
jgi:hypothetical protein